MPALLTIAQNIKETETKYLNPQDDLLMTQLQEPKQDCHLKVLRFI